MPSADCVIALTTLPADADVDAFGRALVDDRLAACVNVLPEMISIYRWEGKVEKAPERQVVMKTTQARLAELRERLRQLHTYDVPEFIVIPVLAVSEEYLKWVRESTGPTGPATTR
jgi:periplasmic divalent cation tolerance protein